MRFQTTHLASAVLMLTGTIQCAHAQSADAPAAHKQTAHYRAWAEAVADMMAVPRSSVKFDKVYPDAATP